MMETYRSEDWSNAHFLVNDSLTALLNSLRDHGYNPSLHLTYDREEHHLLVDPIVLNKHEDVKRLYLKYVEACNTRDSAVDEIQTYPKLDLGF